MLELGYWNMCLHKCTKSFIPLSRSFIPLSRSLFQLVHFLQTASIIRNLEVHSTCKELVGNLQTFEVNHFSIKKSKGIALITSKPAKEDSDAKSNRDSDDVGFEALFVRKLKRFLKKQKRAI